MTVLSPYSSPWHLKHSCRSPVIPLPLDKSHLLPPYRCTVLTFPHINISASFFLFPFTAFPLQLPSFNTITSLPFPSASSGHESPTTTSPQYRLLHSLPLSDSSRYFPLVRVSSPPPSPYQHLLSDIPPKKTPHKYNQTMIFSLFVVLPMSLAYVPLDPSVE